MACTSVRVLFEIGHEASLKAKQTADGFTHDWKLFVRGVDNAEIHHFVEKVIFHLHETFQNPKRVIKEPPYMVRESGYAGFALLVDIYFKSKQESTKARFEYQLTLPEAGPPISNKIREEYVFNNPPEEFRRKLIRGGGFGVGEESITSSHMTSNSSQSDADHKNSLKNKSSPLDLPSAKKLKKENTPKNEEKLNANDPFSIFGQPINPSKIPLVNKSNSKLISSSEKLSQSDKQVHSSKPPKHNTSSHKDKDRDKEKDREKDKEKERDKEKHKTKDRDKEKEKSAIKKSKDESMKKDKSKEEKMKILKSSKEEAKKNVAYHDEKPPKEKPSSLAATLSAPLLVAEKSDKEAKAEKKDKEKKHKEEKKQKSKEKREKTSSSDKKENIDAAKENYGAAGGDRVSILEKHQLAHSAPPPPLAKDDSYSCAAAIKEEKKAARKADAAAKDERLEAKAKEKLSSVDSKSVYSTNGSMMGMSTAAQPSAGGVDAKKDEKHKHHKHKKDKSKKDGKRDKDEKKEKLKEAKGKCTPPVAPLTSSTQPMVLLEPTTVTPKHEPGLKHATKKPLDQLFSSEKSDSDSSSVEDEPPAAAAPPPPMLPVKTEPAVEALVKEEPSAELQHSVHKSTLPDAAAELESAPKKKKSKKSAEEKEAKKRKRKSKEKGGLENVVAPKVCKYEGGPPAEPVKSNSLAELQPESRSESRHASLSPASNGGSEPKFTDEYITKLKELQRKIMTLEDNSGLQRIVQVVAETGQYEITTKTFDFDLCSLDESIVNRLSDFFLP